MSPRGGVGIRAAGALAVLLVAGAPGVVAASPMERALDYLSARQDAATGAVGPEAGRTADTSWTAVAAAGAGESPAGWVRAGGASLAAAVTALPAGAGGDILRLAVARRAAGSVDADLAARVAAQQSADGSFAGGAVPTAWGVLALRAVGREPGDPAVSAAVAALGRLRLPDGGWAVAQGATASDAVGTATAMQALRAARVPVADPVLQQARARLLALRDPGGLFDGSAVPTAWAILAIRAMGERPGRGPWGRGGSPVAALERLQDRDGGVRTAPGGRASVFSTAVSALAWSQGLLPVSPGTRATPDRAPRVVRRTPATGDMVRGVLSVRYVDERGGTGVDPARTTVSANGVDITRRARITPFTLQVRPQALPAGMVTVAVRVRDRAGHMTLSEWTVSASG